MDATESGIHSWLAANDPQHAHLLRAALPTAAAVASGGPDAGASPGSGGGAVSGAVVAGPRAEQDLAESRSVGDLKKSPDGQQFFRTHPMDGCTSVMNMARESAGYDPTAGFTPDAIARYHDYTRRLSMCPFFNLEMTDTVAVTRKSDDYDQLISDVADLFDGIEQTDRDKIKSSITRIAQAAASNSETAQSEDLFVQNVLYAANDDQGKGTYTVFIYASHVSMVEHTSKHSHEFQSDYTVQRTKLVFRAEEWPLFADKVWNLHTTSADDWLTANNTPNGSKPANMCLKPA